MSREFMFQISTHRGPASPRRVACAAKAEIVGTIVRPGVEALRVT